MSYCGAFARPRADHQVQARERRLGDVDGRVDALAVEGALEQGLDPLAHLGIDAVARQVDQAATEAPVAVAAHEQARALALLQREHAMRDLGQFLGRGLEQLVARQGLEDVAQRLAAVALGLEARALHHRIVLDAAPAGCPTGGARRRSR